MMHKWHEYVSKMTEEYAIPLIVQSNNPSTTNFWILGKRDCIILKEKCEKGELLRYQSQKPNKEK